MFWRQVLTNSLIPFILMRLPRRLSVYSFVFLNRPSPRESMTSFPMPQLARLKWVRCLLQLSIVMMAFVSWMNVEFTVFFDTSRSLPFKISLLIGTVELLESANMNAAIP